MKFEDIQSFMDAEEYTTGLLSGITFGQWILILLVAFVVYRNLKARGINPLDWLWSIITPRPPQAEDEVVVGTQVVAREKTPKQRRASQWETALRMVNACVANGDPDGVKDVIGMIEREGVEAAQENARDVRAAPDDDPVAAPDPPANKTATVAEKTAKEPTTATP